MRQEKVILMLSGGRDSFLAGCILLEDRTKDYKLLMVTYDNGCSIGSDNAETVAERIISKYGNDRAEYLGLYKVDWVIRNFFSPYFNMKPADQAREFAGMTPSQFHCLICRTSMYLFSIWLAKINKADYIAEGGREDQGFVIELPGMAQERFTQLVRKARLEQLLPVYDLNDNLIRDNALISRGYICKSYEPKCLIGWPLEGSVDETVIEGVHNYYDNVILPMIDKSQFLDDEFIDRIKAIISGRYDERTV